MNGSQGASCSSEKSQTGIQLEYTDRQIKLLDKEISELETKLVPVMINQLSEVSPEGKEKEAEILSPVASSIRNMGKQIERFNIRIGHIKERLEI